MEASKTDIKNKLGTYMRAAIREPVLITDHGKPSHVLVSIEEWQGMLRKIEDAEQGEATKLTPREADQ